MEGREERIAKVKSQIRRHVKTRMLAKEEVSDAMMHILKRDKERVMLLVSILQGGSTGFDTIIS